jgi:bifunctional DNA-binding transcriptional regulator/antitoxin component of YhaV-PrlF toxin-antitoxin module
MNIGRITGLPVRVLSFHRVCIPAEYLKYFGLSAGSKANIITGESWLKISADGNTVCQGTKVTLQKNQVLRLPGDWVLNNRIRTGDLLFLLGTTGGMILYTNKRRGSAG